MKSISTFKASRLNKAIVSALLIGSAFTSIAHAAPAMSWNLSRDMIQASSTGSFGPSNVWTLMQAPAGNMNQSNYVAFDTYNTVNFMSLPVRAWTTSGIADLSASIAPNDIPVTQGTFYKGVPMLHPTPTKDAVVRWTSPVSGSVKVLARISDANGYCGDGVKWVIQKNAGASQTGLIANGWNEGSIFSQTINVQVGDKLYFKVGAGSSNHQCDSTYVDVLIAK